jgi:hypothetical protein
MAAFGLPWLVCGGEGVPDGAADGPSRDDTGRKCERRVATRSQPASNRCRPANSVRHGVAVPRRRGTGLSSRADHVGIPAARISTGPPYAVAIMGELTAAPGLLCRGRCGGKAKLAEMITGRAAGGCRGAWFTPANVLWPAALARTISEASRRRLIEDWAKFFAREANAGGGGADKGLKAWVVSRSHVAHRLCSQRCC